MNGADLSSNLIERVYRRVYTPTVRRAVRWFGVEPILHRAYWWVLSNTDDSRTVRIDDASATLRTTSMSEFGIVRNTRGPERPVYEDLIERLQPDDVFYDVGANIGLYTCLAGDVVRPGNVVAFEPYPPNADRLAENLALNGQETRVYRYALSDSREVVELSVLDTSEPGSAEHSIEETYAKTDREVETIEVETVAGSTLIREENLPAPSVLKIDVEGAGPAVLDGLTPHLRSDDCRLVYCEPHDNAEALCERLDAYGFELEQIQLTGYRSDDEATIRATRP